MNASAPDTRVRPAAVLIPFALLCAYGLLRWQTLLPAAARGRLLGLLGVAVLAAALTIGRTGAPRRGAVSHGDVSRGAAYRGVGIAAVAIAALAMLPISGLPLSWVTHVRVAASVRAIGDGITALPAVNVPYIGGERSIRMVIALSGGALMLGSALALRGVLRCTGSPSPVRERRLVVAAAPLLVLTMLPSVLGRPRDAELHGVVAFVLVVSLLFGWRFAARRALAGAVVVALAAYGGVVIAQGLAPRHALVSFRQVVGTLAPAGPVAFDWRQTYGPLKTAGDHTTVLLVHAAQPEYWKAADLDSFDGTGWTQRSSGLIEGTNLPSPEPFGVSDSSLTRWTQTLTVTVKDMRTDTVIAAGVAGEPQLTGATPGAEPGTWVTATALGPGSGYSVQAYAPKPDAAQLEAAGAHYPLAQLPGELTIALPRAHDPADQPTIQFAPYGSKVVLAGGSGRTLGADLTALERSPYAPVLRLAQSLKRPTRTPYEYVVAVERYLQQNYRYVTDPPPATYPIVSFLLRAKRGYCQQFAGAMALLLRMGGVPARVAVGFTTGSDRAKTGTYAVTAGDAHAWVEAWFPRYGWVPFDPTPGANAAAVVSVAPAADGAAAGVLGALRAGLTPTHSHRGTPRARPSARKRTSRRAGGLGAGALASGCAGLACVLALAWLGWLYRRQRALAQGASGGVGYLVAELQAALVSCRRTLPAATTLAQLERSLAASSPLAAEYVCRVRLARFAGAQPLPSSAQRRALRAWLRHGRGLRGWVRAWLALPPRA